jgi:general secretion pathway protein L
MLPLLLAEATPAVTSITLYHEDNDSHAAELLGELDTSLSIKGFTASPLSILAQHLHDARQLNILQGDYAPKKQRSPLLKPWKAVAALAGVWLILQLIYAGIETVQLKEKNQQLTQQIEKEFKRAIPSAKKFTGMRSRIKTTLKELRGGLSDDTQQHFLQILADATPALASNPKISINGIVYRNRRIDIELQADSLQSLEAVKNQLVAIPQLKTLLSTSVEKDKVNGRLRLEKQS